MVFETVVIDVLNRFLGEYVENLDSSQLKIGIWGGDVVLKDLILKETALDELNLPIKVTWGQLGKLVLKIPWKNLYSAPVIVNIEDLFLLASPQNEIVYVPEREERWAQESKQAELRRVEEAKRLAAEKDAIKTGGDSFVEKLVTQIVKNVHVEMKNIHIRYEDRSTNRNSPFSVGATLSSLTVQTTDKDLNPCFAADDVTFIYKVLKLDGLSIYWNPNSDIKSSMPNLERIDFFRSSIPTGTYQPPGYNYVFGPISSLAKLVLNPKPETDGTNYNTPKIELDINMDEFSLALTRRQFQDMILLMENMDRLSKGAPYRKFRPDIKTYKENYRLWWRFAYQCILVDIQRRKRDWDWRHILTHRNMCRDYQKCYVRILTPKPPQDALIRVRELELALDVLNLVLLRERASVEAQRLQEAEEKARASRGWFSGWFGRGTQPVTESEQFSADVAMRIENAMTPEEKSKLYQAIDYQENAVPAFYPPTFVATRLRFRLAATRVRVLDDSSPNSPLIVDATLQDLSTRLEQRPSVSALRVEVSIGCFSVVGVKQSTGVPQLIQSSCDSNQHLIDILFETNPLDGRCDQRVHVSARPLTIIYNHETIEKLQDIFTSVDTSGINEIKAKTAASLPTFKQMSSMGLQFAMERRTRLDVRVSVSSSTLLVPYEGIYLANRSMLIVKLGQLRVETEEQKTSGDISVKQLFLQGSTEEEIFSSIVSESYTKFCCQLTGVQIMMRLENEDWESQLDKIDSTPLHILQPTNLEVIIKKSLVTEDARIPKMIIEGKLPSIIVNISEERLLALAGLVFSIPQKAEKLNQDSQSRSSSTWSLASLGSHLEHKIREKPKTPVTGNDLVGEIVQGVDLICRFELNEFTVTVRKVEKNLESVQFIYLAVRNLQVELIQKTFETVMGMQLAAVDFIQRHEGEDLHVLATGSSQGKEYLFSMDVASCEKTAPDFYTKKEAVLTRLNLRISQSCVILHQRAILDLMDFINSLTGKIDQVKMARMIAPEPSSTNIVKRKLSQIMEEGETLKPVVRSRRRANAKRVEVVDLKANVTLEQIAVIVRGDTPIAQVAVDGITVGMSSRQSYSTYDIKLRSLSVIDLNPATKYSTVVMSPAKETIRLNVTLYNKEFINNSDGVDMAVVADLEQIRLVYLYWFISQLMEFSNSFQTAKDAVKEASSVAAERARQNMIKAYENATRLSLKVHLKAPIIVVPLNSISSDALVIDLGVLTVKNSFTNLEKFDDRIPVMDTMNLELSELTVTRASVNQKTVEVMYEYPLLEPVTFELVVKRNLSASWYKKVPDLEIFSRLRKVCVSLDQQDYAFALAVLSENHAEGGVDKAAKNVPAQHSELTDREGSADEALSVHTAILFSFSLESFVLSLYPGGVRQVGAQQHKLPRKEHGLARFLLETLVLKGKMFSNGSLCTSIKLVNCLLQDTRKGKEGRLTTLMERKQEADISSNATNSGPSKSMVDITYEQKANSKFVDIRVFSFTLVLSMDYLMKVGAFFSVESSNPEPPVKTQTVQTIRRSRAASTAQAPAKIQEPSTDLAMTIVVHLEKPDIMIVENMDDINTDALVFHTELVLNYRTSGPKQVINANLTDLQLYSCCFNPEKRRKTMQQVVKPMTLSVAGSNPEGKGLHIELCCTPVNISVSPNTIQLMSLCYAALSNREDPLAAEKEKEDWSGVWDVKPFKESDYWFLSPDETFEAVELVVAPKVNVDELCLISVPSIVITVEAGVGNRTIPMLLLQMGLEGQARNWTSGLHLDTTLSLGMQYFNTSLTAWEPIIEPIEAKYKKESLFVPWQITLQVVMYKPDESDPLPDDFTPAMSVTLNSNDPLEITITKTGLDVISQLQEAFTNAVNATQTNVAQVDAPTYLIKNDTEVMAVILLEASQLNLSKKQESALRNVELQSGSQVEINLPTGSGGITFSSPSTPSAGLKLVESFMTVSFPELKTEQLSIPVSRPVKRFYPVTGPPGASGWGIVAEITSGQNTTTILLRSVVQIINQFSVPIDVLFMTWNDNEVELIGTVDPYDVLNVPLRAVYSPTNELFFRVEGYSVSIVPFVWKELQRELNIAHMLQCDSKFKEDRDPFFIKAVGEVEQVYFGSGNRRTMASLCYNIHLQPTVEILNSLPTAVTLAAQGNAQEIYIRPGNKIHIPQCQPGVSTITLRISDYLEKEWSCRRDIPSNPPEYFVLCFESFDSVSPVSLNLGVHCTIVKGTISLALYCPFWMINKTGHLLSYKFDDGTPVIYHPNSYNDPVMFSPSSRKFLGKKKGSVKVGQGDWSDKFSLDVAGSAGLVDCKDSNGSVFKLSVTIRLTYSGLTKMIVFTPAYVVLNKTLVPLEFQEEGEKDNVWHILPSDSCESFWPTLVNGSKLRVRVSGTEETTPSFNYHSTFSCLLKLSNKYGGIFVDVQSTAGGIYINLYPYQPGLAPSLVLNHTNEKITLWEKGSQPGRFYLEPNHLYLHTWEKPSGPCILNWMLSSGEEFSSVLGQDSSGEMRKNSLWYISFLDGMQRILLFTDEESISHSLQVSGILEKLDQEITVNIHGIGISIINNLTQTDLLYIGLVSSGVIWETRKEGGRRFKPIAPRESTFIEKGYQKYIEGEKAGVTVDALLVIDNKIQINLETMEMLAPNKRFLRRTFQPGLRLSMQKSPHNSLLHASVNRLQIDNQTSGCFFPVILAPVPPPKTVAAGQGPKPFIEISLLERITSRSTVRQYKYFKVLVQEFHVKLDIGLVHEVLAFMASEKISETVVRQRFLRDVQLSRQPLMSHINVISSQEQKNFYDLLHFSPLKIHLSFSLAGNMESKALPPALSVILQSLGVTLTDINDAVFRLSYFERKNAFHTQSQLQSEAVSHYTGQALRQIYVIVFGLDVIGNPFGLITGIGEGVEALFYEPIQGIIQGPAEFAEGVGLGVKSLFGHTVGGAAGAFSRITGTLGKGLAVLSMDKEYQQQRQEQQNRRNEPLHTSVAQGGKGLVMGVVHGVTGVVTKPISGAKEEGVGGFFKGMGKGVMGLVTRPVTGVVDFASTSLNVVKRATEQGGEASRIRAPRLMKERLVVPYQAYEAEGNKMLNEIDNRRFAGTDVYHFHWRLHNGDVLILSDKRFLIITMNDVFGTWQINLTLTWTEIASEPSAVAKGIVIQLGRKKSPVFSSSNRESKIIPLLNQEERQLVLEKMLEVYSQEVTSPR